MMISNLAQVSPKAKIGVNVTISAFTIIHDNVEIGDDTFIGSYCELGIKTNLGDGTPLKISQNSVIRSHSTFYESSSFGDELVTGHRVTVREMTKAGDGFQIGTLSDLQGHCLIGNYVKTHSNVHIGHGSTIGDYVWLFPYVVLTNDPHPPSEVQEGVTVEKYSVISTMTTVMPGVIIKEGTFVGAHANVTKNTEPESLVLGNPAKKIGDNSLLIHKVNKESAYPWRKHFHRGYPKHVIDNWIKEFEVKDGQ